MEQSFATIAASARPPLSARSTSTETEAASRAFARLGAGLGLAALYGLALGARRGGVALVQHALAASAGLAVVGGLGLPALFVLLALVNAPISPRTMLAVGARSLASAGFVLAGLAPSAALLAVTIESAAAAAFVTRAGLLLAGGIGLFQLLGSLRGMLRELTPAQRLKCDALLAAFCLFAITLAARVWDTLPILRGGR